MSEYSDDLENGFFAFDSRLSRLSDLISSVDRPGDYCAHGRFFTPMPRLRVGRIGPLAFPLQLTQLQELIALGERAPYGRGQETILDRSVRDCWQISPDRVRLEGASWDEAFDHILNHAAEGLGYARDAVQAELYKLLVYETGGFFAPHRDTEKADGMIATLVIALPVAGKGGELIIRHHDRETAVHMRSEDPSELVYAAFYCDCEHEIRPVTEGHRVCLVYNLVVSPGGRVAASVPDYTDHADRIAEEIRARFSASDAPEKLVWLLDHDYSEAGLSFESLKNVDAAVGRTLIAAAPRAGCVLHAAIVHVEESAAAEYYGRGYVYEIMDIDEEDYELGEIFERRCELDDWMHPNLGSVEYGQLELNTFELMPPEKIMDWEPDESRLLEASGNAGAEIERLYRKAAFVLWPAKDGPRVLAQAGTQALSILLEQAVEGNGTGGGTDLSLDAVATEIAGNWPVPGVYMSRSSRDEWEQESAAVLSRLRSIGIRKASTLFLDRVVVPHYGPGLNNELVAAASASVDADTPGRLRKIISEHGCEKPGGVVDLVVSLSRETGRPGEAVPQDVPEDLVRRICLAVPGMIAARKSGGGSSYREGSIRQKVDPIQVLTLQQIFQLAWHYGLEDDLTAAVEALIEAPKVVRPDRKLPPLLSDLGSSHPEPAAASRGFARLWKHSAKVLLTRSAVPPPDPVDWAISTKGLSCGCSSCAELVRFCVDPVATTHRIPVRKELRAHLRSRIGSVRADLECRTERRGSPYSLICTKTRGSHERRRRQYAEDISEIERLLSVAERVPDSSDVASALQVAVERSRGQG